MTAKRPRGPRLTPKEIFALEDALLKEPHVPASAIGRRLGIHDSTAQAHKRRVGNFGLDRLRAIVSWARKRWPG